jgi:hypothetical protein
MCHHLFILLFSILFGLAGRTQDSSRFVIKPGQTIAEVIKPAIMYRYPEFKMGKAYIMNGTVASAKMNYNRVIEEVQFINLKGDTVSIANESTINMVTIGEDTFMFKTVYLEILQDLNVVKLAVRERLRLADRQKIGAYGQPTTSASIDTYESYLDGYKRYNIVANEQLILVKENMFYMGTAKNNFFVAGKKQVLKEFAKYRIELMDYFNKKDVDFTNESEIRELCTFIAEQSKKAAN